MHYKFCLVCLPIFLILSGHIRLRWIGYFVTIGKLLILSARLFSIIWLVKPSALTACCVYIYVKQVGFVLCMSRSGLQMSNAPSMVLSTGHQYACPAADPVF